MTTYIQTIIEFAGQHPTWAGLLVFATAAAEAVAVVGVFIPGTAILIGIGAIAGLGHLSLWSILVWAALDAIAGDGISYWFGHRYRHHIVKVWPFSTRPDLLGRSEAFIHRHGAKSVAIGRFVPALRSFVPLAAGVLGMSRVRFYVANVLSALVWSPAHILPGVALEISFGVLEGISSRLALFLLTLTVFVVFAGWLLRLAISRVVPLLDRLRQQIANFLHTRKQYRIARALLAFLDPSVPGARSVLLLGVILAVTMVGFLGVAEDVVARGELARADAAVSTFVQGLRTPWNDAAMVVVTMMGDTIVTVSVSLVAILWLLWRRAWRLAAGFAVALLLAGAFVGTVKWVLAVPRPAALHEIASEYSFPSGHATMAAVLYGILAWLAFVSQPDRRRTWPFLATGAFVGAVATSRIYLAAHWPSDVAAGLLFGFGLAAAFGLVFRRFDVARLQPRGLLLACLAAAIIIGGTHAARSFERQFAAYAPRENLTTISMQAWLDGGWHSLPDHRIDLDGDAREPLTLQWAGSAEVLRRHLLAEGWSEPPAWSAATMSMLVSARANATSLPVLPTLHNGREPVVTLVAPYPSADARMILRLWPSQLRISMPKGTRPLFVASVTQERIWHPLGLLSWPRNDPLVADQYGAFDASKVPADFVGRNVGNSAGRMVLATPESWADTNNNAENKLQ